MKKITLLFIFTAVAACKKNADIPTSNNKVLWAEAVQTTFPFEGDPLLDKADWNAATKYDKGKIFSSITNAVLSGKLKAYMNYPSEPFTAKEFSDFLVSWDSTNQVEDVNNPGVFIAAPLKRVIVADEIAQLKFNEKIEFDTVSYSLIKKVSHVTFFIHRMTEVGNIAGYKKLFDVKLNE